MQTSLLSIEVWSFNYVTTTKRHGEPVSTKELTRCDEICRPEGDVAIFTC